MMQAYDTREIWVDEMAEWARRTREAIVAALVHRQNTDLAAQLFILTPDERVRAVVIYAPGEAPRIVVQDADDA